MQFYICSYPNTIGTAQGPDDIAEFFKTDYDHLYNSVPYNHEDMENLLADIDKHIDLKCMQGLCNTSHHVTACAVSECIKQLKHRKSDGYSGHCTDHFINGTPRLHTVLSLLISSMISHGYAPEQLSLATIIPIIKNKRKSANDVNNYRGIALSSVLGKLIDLIIIDSQCDSLKSSELQFGFTKGCSTSKCTFVADETINYYLTKKSQVYSVFLDASKAFDRVHYVKLFRMLLQNNTCPIIARFLAFMYTNNKCRVKWDNALSNSFHVTNGVRQGGVLSPILFNVYMDVLLSKLKETHVGCHIGNKFTAAVAYADDVLLMSPSLNALKMLLSVCESYSRDYNIQFNAAKSKFLVFGSPQDVPAPASISMQNHKIECVISEKHLGHIISSDGKTCDARIQQATYELYGKANLLIAQFANASPDVKYHLFKSFCMSLYGCSLWDLSSPAMSIFFVAWRKCIRRLLDISPRSHSYLLHLLCDDAPVEVQIHRRFVNFMSSCYKSQNDLVALASKLAIAGSRSGACNSLNYICSLYNIDKFNMFETACPLINKTADAHHILEASRITDFLHLRFWLSSDYSELTDIINLLCTA